MAILLLLVASLPSIRSKARAAVVVLDTFGVTVPRLLAADVEVSSTEVNGVPGRLYSPPQPSPALLMVPGATPAGVEDPRVDAVASALARSGRMVFVPELELYQERFDQVDLERIVQATKGLAESSGEPVSITGFSYGGSFALVAAADPRLEGKVARVSVLGAYFDLRGVVQAITTGVSLVDGALYQWEPHPAARDVLYARAVELAPEDEREEILDVLAGHGDAAALSPPGRALYDLLANRHPARTFELADDLPDGPAQLLERFSPATVADRIRVPVLAMHSVDDPLVPYGELRRFDQGLPEARTQTVGLFSHVDFDPASPGDWINALPDLWRVVRFASFLLDG